ncbi:MAG TPA: dihydrodipicolinate synthase family protein [Blastocatellia bacterium]|nr:dihydrodipicolinate synthase family protein [Blastocatellia bacterium]HMY72781.1 dihydrodipicolinate synthase family protein [Blastocatellia bacterium]HMZ20728.1 dihydrodipicolinate synthase family protein [Blastocatellia bacterium]HNG34736.1 dihydrodipicolinate synthase family protein [Blastocatellia bacterium]
MTIFQGILPAVCTPFDTEGRFRADSFERLLDRCYAAGADGIYVCGQTGEGLQQSAAQRKLVAETAVKASPKDKTIIVHIGAMSTAEAVELAKHSARIGAHAVSALPPLGNYSFAEIKAYYAAIAAAADVPLLIYYFPAYAPSVNSTAQILELCAIPNIIGLKFTANDLFLLSEIKKSGATIFYGTDEMLVAGLIMGADGGIGSFYNVAPELFVRLYQQTLAGEWEQARQTQRSINELISIGLNFPVVPVVKAMLRRQGLDCGECLPPRRSLTAEEENRLDQMLARSEVGSALFAGANR